MSDVFLYTSMALAQGIDSPAFIEEQEFDLLYRATAGPLLRYFLATTGRRETADDLLQETYCRFLGQGRRFEDIAESRRYLFRIGTNLLRDSWRRRERALQTEAPEATHLPDYESMLHVQSALQTLKPREREILWLAYVEGMSHREIAEVTGLKVLSIRMLLFRARKRAATLLQRGV